MLNIIFACSLIMIFSNLLCADIAQALPKDYEVVSGSADFRVDDQSTLTINASSNAIVNYRSFDIAASEKVIVNMPDVNSRMLNRVISADPTNIYGTLLVERGLFVLVNESGIHIAPGAAINASQLVLSTRDITNANFLSGNYVFERISKDAIDRLLLNEGKITIENGGFGVLIAGAIENKGIITAHAGTIALAGGDAVRLSLSANSLISIAIDKAAAGDIVDYEGNKVLDQINNLGTLSAQGGVVILSADSLPHIFRKAINLDGVVEASKVEEREGHLRLVARGEVALSGKVNASTIEIGQMANKIPSIQNVIPELTQAPVAVSALPPEIDMASTKVIIEEAARINAATMISITAKDLIRVGSTIEAPAVTLVTGGSVETRDAAIIAATNLNIAAYRFGTSVTPVNLLADRIHITRLSGDIDIRQSLGMGTSVMITGPPDGGFGQIVYNRSTDLSLEASRVSVSEGAFLAGRSITLTAQGGISSYGSLLADGNLSLFSEGPIISLGVLSADTLTEQGASFLLGGTSRVRRAYIWNADHAVNYGTGTFSGFYGDAGNIIIDANAIITLVGDTTFSAGTDGSGFFRMNNNSTITGNHNLAINASSASTLRVINNIASLTLGRSQAVDPTYTMQRSIQINGSLTLNSGITLNANTYNITLGGNWTNSGTFNAGTGTVTFSGAADQYIQSGGDAFNNLVINKSAGGVYLKDALSVGGDLTVTSGTLYTWDKVAIYPNITITGSFSNAGTFSGSNSSMYLAGDFTNSGTLNTTVWTLYLNGGSSQSITSGSQTLSAIAHTGSGSVTLMDDLDIGSSLVNSQGSWTCGSHAVTIDGPLGGTFNNSAVFNAPSSSMTVYGNFINSGTFNHNGGTVVLRNILPLTDIYITSGAGAFNNLTLTGSRSKILMDDLDVNGAFHLQSGTFDANGKNQNCAGNFTLDIFTGFVSGGTLTFDGDLTVTTAGQNIGTVVVGHSPDTVSLASDLAAASVTIDAGDSLITNGYNITLTGFLTIASGAPGGTLDATHVGARSSTITLGGSWTNNGTFTADTSTIVFDAGIGLTQFLDSGGTGTGNAFNNLTHSGAGELRLTGNPLDVNGTFTNSLGSFRANGLSMYISGNIVSSAEFYGNDNTTYFDGTSSVTMTGDLLKNALYNVVIGTAASGGAVTIAGGTDAMIIGNLSFNNSAGAASLDLNGRTLYFRGSSFDLTGASSFPVSGKVNFIETGITVRSAAHPFNNVVLGGNILIPVDTSVTLADDMDIHGTFSTTETENITLDISNRTLTMSGSSFNLTGVTTFTVTGSTVIFDGSTTLIDSSMNSFNNVTITGTLIAPSANMNVAGNWANSGTFTHNSGTVTLNGAGQTVIGATTFNNLTKIVSVAGGGADTLTFDRARVIVIGTTTLKGESGAILSLVNATPGYQWVIDPRGARDIQYVNVRDGINLSLPVINPANSVDSGNNINWFSAGSVSGIWVGFVSNDWGDAGNWAADTVPLATDDVFINPAANYALLNGAYTVNDITIASSGRLDAGAGTLTVNGDWTNHGTFNAGTGTVEFAGGGTSTILGNNAFYNLTCDTPGMTLKFDAAPGVTQTINGLLTFNSVSLVSVTPGAQWHIDPKGGTDISNVYVQDSYNESGRYLLPHPTTSVNGGNNYMWFTPVGGGLPPGEDPWDPPIIVTPPVPQWKAEEDIIALDLDELVKKYRKGYKAGKYKTIVIVFEGRVVMTPYDEKGADIAKSVSISAGELAAQKGEVR